MRRLTLRQHVGLFIISMVLTPRIRDYVNNYRFWHGPRTGDGRLAEVAVHNHLNNPVNDRFRHLHGADTPGAN